jgi:drug/metabolite transporter (DMT)-like permease
VSPLRVYSLVAAMFLCGVAGILLVDGSAPGTSRSDIGWMLALASVVHWGAFLTLTVRECNEGRFSELAGQIAAVAEMIGEYGDRREAAGYLTGVRESAEGHLSRVK